MSDVIHMPAQHGLPLSEFLAQVFIFVGFFIALHAFLDIVKAGGGMAIIIGLLIVTIGCMTYLIDQHKRDNS